MKRILIVTAMLSLPLMLNGCNTIQGIGQDIKDGGQAMSHAINGDKPKDKEF